ncbi:hypothetical protein [Thiohalomonas denitrificans]|uniref:HEPN domain-containing protein n=1 Tax=Thiohalomonas denitrificans TaxID=415747 RepID=A0A1G5PUE1_9GAMM|nr:hypothetical protein [Thiohalomonas denitrificans]SCZ53194.1 hypothetical protein SAMN03097708_00886 [Thiohalomonas denitrificans]
MQDIRGELETYQKIDIAMEYLNLALREYISDKNMFSVIHLAGAAEELLGKIVSINKNESALERARHWLRSWYGIIGKDTPLNTHLNKHILNIKNGIKHINDSGDLEIELDLNSEAKKVIHRAIENFNQIPQLDTSEELLAYYQHKKV